MPLDLQPVLDLQPMPQAAAVQASSPQESEQMPQPSMLQRVANSAPVEAINALGGGIQQGAADAIGTAIGSPATTQALSPPSFVQDAQADFPTTSGIGKVVGMVAPAVAAIGATGGALAPAIGEGLVTDLAANTIAGSILAGPGNRTLGGAVGLVGGTVGKAVSSAANYLDNAFTITNKLKSVVSDIAQKIQGPPSQVAAQSQANMWNVAASTEKQMAQGFKSNEISTVPTNAANAAADVLAKYNNPKTLGSLSNEQETILKQIVNWGKSGVVKANPSSIMDNFGKPIEGADKIIPATQFSMDELHTTRKAFDQIINQAGAQVDRGMINQGIARDLSAVRKPLEMDLQGAAEKAGVLDKYLQFNDFYKNTMLPLINTGAKETFEALGNSERDPLTAAKITDGLINKFVNPARPDVTKAFLNTLDPTGRQAVETHIVGNALAKATAKDGTIDPLAFKKTIQAHQTAFDGVFSEDTNKMLHGLNNSVDSATKLLGMPLNLSKSSTSSKLLTGSSVLGTIGLMAGPHAAILAGTTMAGLAAIMKSQVGQKLLIKAGSVGGQEIGKDIVNGIAIQGVLNASQANTPPEQPAQGAQ